MQDGDKKVEGRQSNTGENHIATDQVDCVSLSLSTLPIHLIRSPKKKDRHTGKNEQQAHRRKRMHIPDNHLLLSRIFFRRSWKKGDHNREKPCKGANQIIQAVVTITDEENSNRPEVANKNIPHHTIIGGTQGVQNAGGAFQDEFSNQDREGQRHGQNTHASSHKEVRPGKGNGLCCYKQTIFVLPIQIKQ